MKRMSECLALVTAYEIGNEGSEYHLFARMTKELGNRDDATETIRTLAQMCWLLASSLQNASGMDRQEVLQWYGRKFAERSIVP
jgi:hypothetical protein